MDKSRIYDVISGVVVFIIVLCAGGFAAPVFISSLSTFSNSGLDTGIIFESVGFAGFLYSVLIFLLAAGGMFATVKIGDICNKL